MKKTISLLSLLLIVIVLSAQSETKLYSTARFGLNGAFFGSGDIIGPCIYGEYAYPVNKYIAISPRIMSGYASRISSPNYDQASSFIGAISLKFTPFPDFFNRLKIDIGGCYSKFIKSYGQLEPSTYENSYYITYGNYYTKNLIGLIGSINLNIIENNKIEAGIRADMITGFYGKSLECESIQAGVYIGFKH